MRWGFFADVFGWSYGRDFVTNLSGYDFIRTALKSSLYHGLSVYLFATYLYLNKLGSKLIKQTILITKIPYAKIYCWTCWTKQQPGFQKHYFVWHNLQQQTVPYRAIHSMICCSCYSPFGIILCKLQLTINLFANTAIIRARACHLKPAYM